LSLDIKTLIWNSNVSNKHWSAEQYCAFGWTMFLWTAALIGPQAGRLNLSQTVTSNEDVPLMRYGEHENLSDISHQIDNHCTKNFFYQWEQDNSYIRNSTLHRCCMVYNPQKTFFPRTLKQSLWTLAVGFMSVRLSFASVHSAFLFSCFGAQ